MTSTDTITAIAERARRVADLEDALDRARADQDAAVVAARDAGTPWADIVAADGRSRQMLNRIYRNAKE